MHNTEDRYKEENKKRSTSSNKNVVAKSRSKSPINGNRGAEQQ